MHKLEMLKMALSDVQCRNLCATENFRDVADIDYISARALYRMGNIQQFFWCGMQCIEKYMKAILLYNGKKFKKRKGHNLEAIFDKIREIKYCSTNFEFPSNMKNKIIYFEKNGCPDSRYNDSSLFVAPKHNELDVLDYVVFYIRRYCRPLNPTLNSQIDDKKYCEELMKFLSLKSIDKSWKKTLITVGILEKIFENKHHKYTLKRKALIWHNLHFGNGKRRFKKGLRPMGNTKREILKERHPECRDILADYIK